MSHKLGRGVGEPDSNSYLPHNESCPSLIKYFSNSAYLSISERQQF